MLCFRSIEDARRESSSSLDEIRKHMNEQNSQWAQQHSRNQEQQQQQRQKERKASNEVYQGQLHMHKDIHNLKMHAEKLSELTKKEIQMQLDSLKSI